jgi:peroxiredoxin
VKVRVAPECRGAPLAKCVAAFVAALCVAFGAPAQAGPAASQILRWTGDTAPAFTLSDTSGAMHSLASQSGPIVLVHFFATWCEPCREELPALNRLAARGAGTLKVVAISVAEVDPRVRRFLDTMPLDFPVLLDRDRAVAKAWNVSTLPTTFVLDVNLHRRFAVETDFAWDSIDVAKLAGLLAANSDGRTISTIKYPTKASQEGG